MKNKVLYFFLILHRFKLLVAHIIRTSSKFLLYKIKIPAHETFAGEQENIFLPAEPMFLPDTPQMQALGGPHLDKQLKLNSFITILGL
jgi:hypothetical protein